MKYLFLLFILILPQISMACATCNVEYSADEKRGFLIATLLLILIPFILGFFIFKLIRKNYQHEN